jgi:hypothetical protein
VRLAKRVGRIQAGAPTLRHAINQRLPELLGVIVAALILVFSAILWYVTREAYRAEPNKGLSAHGQFGDSFGSLNALFTGMALGGLVYTALLQLRQLREQQKEIESQERDSRDAKVALAKEARSQFLTARLQAQAAMLQANSVMLGRIANISGNVTAIWLAEIHRDLVRHRTAIALLLLEAKQAVTGDDWSPAVQRDAIRRFLVAKVRTHCQLLDRLIPTRDSMGVAAYIDTANDAQVEEFQVLLDDYADLHSVLREAVNEIIQRLSDAPKSDNARAWLAGAESHVLAPSHQNWRTDGT